MFTEAFMNKFPTPTAKQRHHSKKHAFKMTMKVVKFSRRPDCYVVHSGNVKCLDCGWENYGHRLGCGKCDLKDMKLGVVYGAYVNTGKLNKGKGPLLDQTEFVKYADLLKRIEAGQRFYDIGLKAELTVKNFQ